MGLQIAFFLRFPMLSTDTPILALGLPVLKRVVTSFLPAQSLAGEPSPGAETSEAGLRPMHGLATWRWPPRQGVLMVTGHHKIYIIDIPSCVGCSKSWSVSTALPFPLLKHAHQSESHQKTTHEVPAKPRNLLSELSETAAHSRTMPEALN